MTEETTNIAIKIASDMTGKDQDWFEGCCDQESLDEDQVVGNELISVIIEAILAIIEQCQEKESFVKNAKRPSIFLRMWAKSKVPLTNELQLNGRRINRRWLANEIVSEASAMSDNVLGAVWDEVKTPNFDLI